MTQGERQDYLFRPTTKDSINLARYDEQANLWYRAFKSAREKNKEFDFKSLFKTVDLIFSFVLVIIWLLILYLLKFIKY